MEHKDNKFGIRLRELRQGAGLTIRELAEKGEVDYSYISKLENGHLPPPSQPVIARLAQALGAEQNELASLSGRIAPDISDTIRERIRVKFGAKLQQLRNKAGLTQQELAARTDIDASYLSKIENGVMPPPSKRVIIKMAEALDAKEATLLELAGRSSNPDIRKLERHYSDGNIFVRRYSMPNIAALTRATALRAALIIVLVAIFSFSLWYASPTPVKAVDINITNGATATKGSTYTFAVQVQIQGTDRLPVQNVNLEIYKSDGSYSHTFTGLPIPYTAGGSSSRSYSGAGGTATITGTTGAGWGYSSTQARYGYGYGYTTNTWATPTFGTNFGYGYGYGGTYIGSTTLTYQVNWLPPAAWPAGTYKIRAIVYGVSGDDTKAFTNDTAATFALSAASSGGSSAGLPGGGGGGGTTTTEPGTTDVSTNVDGTGRFVVDVKAKSQDKKVNVNIIRNTVGKDKDGNPLSEITVTPMSTPTTSPGKSTIGLTYNLGPDGARFDPAITLSFTYDPANIPDGVDEENLSLAFWDGNKWVELTNVKVDPKTNTITGETDHFTEFAIIASTAPADIVASDLSVSPQDIGPGETVEVTFTVTNNGDLAGQQDIILLVNGSETNRQSVTLEGGESQELTFSTTRASNGTYTVEVAGLKGSFTVAGAAEPEPAPTAPAPAPPAPAPALTTPTPAPTTPAQVPPEPEPMNMMMIILIAIAAIIVVGIVVWYAMKNMR